MCFQVLVQAGIGCEFPLKSINNQVFLADGEFVTAHQDLHGVVGDIDEIPHAQRRAAKEPLSHFANRCDEAKQAMAAAYRSVHYTLKEIMGVFRHSLSYCKQSEEKNND